MPAQFDGESVWDSFLIDKGLDIEEEEAFLDFLSNQDIDLDLATRKILEDAYVLFVDEENA